MPTATDAVWVDVLPSMKGFGRELEKEGGKQATKAGAGIGKALGKAMIVGGAAVAGFAAFSVKQFSDFQASMNEVFTLMPELSQGAMDSMSDDVRAFSREMGVATDKVVPALYQAISAGVPKENVFEFLEVAQKAAMGGVTELETAVDGISSVVNAYGDDVIDAAQASDLMFTAVKLGKTDFDQLSSTLFNVIPTASSLGVEFGDVTAALASMTAQGVPTSVATTQLRQAFVELSKEGGATSDTFQEIAGKTFKEFIAEGGNTADALELLAGHAEDTGVGVNDLFGSVEAGAAALALTGGNMEGFRDNIAEMGDSAGATDAAYEQMDQGIGRAFERLKIQAQDVMLEFGERLAPVVERVGLWIGENLPGLIDRAWDAFSRLGDIVKPIIDEITGAITAFGAAWSYNDGDITSSGLPGFMERLGYWARQTFDFILNTAVPALRNFGDWVQRNTAWLIPLAAGVTAIVVAVKAWNAALLIYQGIQKAVVAVTAAWNAVLALNPIGVVILAIVGLVAALTVAYKRSETFRDIVDRAWQAVYGVIRGVVDWFTGTAWPAIKGVYDAVAGAALWLWQDVLQPAWEGIRLAVQVAIELIKLYWHNVLKPVFNAVASVASWLWNSVLSPVFGWISDRWNRILAGMRAHWNTVLKPTWDAISTAAKWMWNKILKPVFDDISARWNVTLEAMKVVWDNVLKPTFDAVGEAVDGVSRAVGTAVEAIGRAWDGLKRAFAAPVNWVIDNVINKFLGWVNDIAGRMGLSLRINLLDNVSWGSAPAPTTARAGPGSGGLNKGGIVPGGGPDRDSVMMPLTPGEYVLSRKTVRQIGVDNLEALNRAGRSGRGLEIGGPLDFIGDIATKALNKARQMIVDVARPGFDAAMGLMDSTVGQWGIPGEFAAGTARTLGDEILDWMAGIEDEADRRTPQLGAGIGWEAMWAAVQGAFPWAQLHSAFRPNAITATGNKSYHGMGRAIDITPSMDIFNWLADNYGDAAEIIFSPANGRQIHNGRNHFYGEPTRGDHWDHIHWAYDQGGMLPPGVSTVANWTGKPEAVLNDSQWKAMQGGTSQVPSTMVIVDADGQLIGRMRVEADQRLVLHDRALLQEHAAGAGN